MPMRPAPKIIDNLAASVCQPAVRREVSAGIRRCEVGARPRRKRHSHKRKGELLKAMHDRIGRRRNIQEISWGIIARCQEELIREWLQVQSP